MLGQIVVVPAPTNLGLRPTGVDRLAQVLIENGLVHSLSAFLAPSVLAHQFTYDHVRDVATGYLNGPGIRTQSLALADIVQQIHRRPLVPIVLGGDCSILIGCMLGLKREGKYGLLFLDGHSDFYDSHESRTGEVAEMDLAIVTGESHPLLADIEARRPYVEPHDAHVFAFREEGLAEDPGFRDVRRYGVGATTLAELRSIGLRVALEPALARVARRSLNGFFVHFDADVLHDTHMPAVDYRMAGGLTGAEAIENLQIVAAQPGFCGMTVSIYNPHLDEDGRAGQFLKQVVSDGLRDFATRDR